MLALGKFHKRRHSFMGYSKMFCIKRFHDHHSRVTHVLRSAYPRMSDYIRSSIIYKMEHFRLTHVWR